MDIKELFKESYIGKDNYLWLIKIIANKQNLVLSIYLMELILKVFK